MMKINSQISDLASLPPCVEFESSDVTADVDLGLDPLSDVHYPLIAGSNDCIIDDTSSPSSNVSYASNSFDSIPATQNSSSVKLAKSAEATTSNQIRVARRSLSEVNQNTRPIAPKVDRGALSSMELSAGQELARVGSNGGTSKAAVPIPKAPCIRPSHVKVKCNQCNDRPEGFRGDHELRRHTERKHSAIRKYFTCKDISPDKKFLASCKACTSNRRYNAYYNATAHLRRAHFNPKQKGRKGKLEPEDRRGGKGGGKEPSMEKLKEWLEVHEEHVSANTQPLADEFEDHEDGEMPYAAAGDSDFPVSSTFAGPQPNSVYSLSPAPHLPANNVSRLAHDVTQPPLSAPISIPRPYNNDFLQLTATNADPSDVFDLSHDTRHDTSTADFAEFPFAFDSFASHDLFDGSSGFSFA